MGATSRRKAGHLFYFVLTHATMLPGPIPSSARQESAPHWECEPVWTLPNAEAALPAGPSGHLPGEAFQCLRTLTQTVCSLTAGCISTPK